MVEVLEPREQIPAEEFDRRDRQLLVDLEEALEVSAGAIFQDQPQIVPSLVPTRGPPPSVSPDRTPQTAHAPVVEFQRVRVRQRVHHLNLVHDLVHLALLDPLDRHIVHGLFLPSLEHLRLTPRADLVEDVVLVL